MGNIRKPNEDSFLTGIPIFLVPDGMGGHSHGDWASHTVVETFASHIPSALVTTPAAILSTISRANSAVQELIDDGEITEVEARLHPERNVTTRAVGVSDVVEPDVWLLPAGGKQMFFVCTDGLTKELEDEQISRIVAKAFADGHAETLAATRVTAVVESGGRDNIRSTIAQRY